MATARDIGIADVAFTADVDLTAVQYYAVAPASTAGNVKIATGTCNPAPFGVLQNSPSAGQEARVRMLGPSKLFVVTGSGSALNYGAYAMVNASGQGIPLATDGGSAIFARNIGATVAVSSSQYAEVFLLPLAVCAVAAS
jgi:hypothetical protein